MAALISAVPVFVPTAPVFPPLYDTQLNSVGNSNFCGPFVAAGALFLLLNGTDAGGVNAFLKVYASFDGGLTWAIQDAAHEPTSAGFGAYTIAQAGNVLHVAIIDGAGDVFVQKFDCAAKLWGLATATAGIATALGLAMVIQPNGTRFIYVQHTGASANVINLLQLSVGDVWSGPSAVLTAAVGRRNNILSAVLDAAGTTHLFYSVADGGTGHNFVLSHIPISNAAVVGAVTVISSNIATPSNTFGTGGPFALAAFNPAIGPNGTYAVPIPAVPNVGTAIPQFVLGDPVGGWATSSPDPGGSTIPVNCGSASWQCLSSGGSLYGFWSVFDNNFAGVVNSVWLASWNGAAWSAPQLLYDAVANPPPVADPPNPNYNPIFVADVGVLPSGGFGLNFFLIVRANPPATHGAAFPVFFGISGGPVAPIIMQAGGGRALAVPRPKTPFPICAPPPQVIDCFACACGDCGVLPLPGRLLEELGFFVAG